MAKNLKSMLTIGAAAALSTVCAPAFAVHQSVAHAAAHTTIVATTCPDDPPAFVGWQNIHGGLFLTERFNGDGEQIAGFEFANIKGAPVSPVTFAGFFTGSGNAYYYATDSFGDCASGPVEVRFLHQTGSALANAGIGVGNFEYFGLDGNAKFESLFIFFETDEPSTVSTTHWAVGGVPGVPDLHDIIDQCPYNCD